MEEIEIKNEVTIGNIILEKGDKIRVLDKQEEKVKTGKVVFKLDDNVHKPRQNNTLQELLDYMDKELTAKEITQLKKDKAFISILKGSEVLVNISIDKFLD